MTQREAILRLTLQRHAREIGPENIEPQLLPLGAADGGSGLAWLAERTDGFSGSDLVQLCSQAAAVPIQEHIE